MKHLENCLLFNTAIGSLNMGDYIIVESVKRELSDILSKHFVVELPTHVPVAHFYQQSNRNELMKFANSCKLKFAAGTNLLALNNLRPWPNFNVNSGTAKIYKNLILVGVGINENSNAMNRYTRRLYRQILSKEFAHSVRDDKSKKMLEDMGLKAINTGCATMWGLTPEHCRDIPATKAESVIFTLTDYNKDYERDQQLIDILNASYQKLYFWVQGSGDLSYLQSLKNTGNVIIVPPLLTSYREVLKKDVDYIGTRLHAGIFAMQYKKRAIILIVDERARSISSTYNINALERCNIQELGSMLRNKIVTNVDIDIDKIQKWKSQFDER